jgi:hypothetical protein
MTLRFACGFLGLSLVVAAGPAAAQQDKPADTAPPPTAAAVQGEGYAGRLRTLERSVNDLGDRVTQVRAKLNLLKDTVLSGATGAARFVIRYKNEMGSTFRLIRAVYTFDGIQILSKADDSGHLAEMTEFDVYNGAVQPGQHTLAVQLTYQGYGYGVFSYLKNYKFEVRASQVLNAVDGKTGSVLVIGREKGGAELKMEDKPAIEFQVGSSGAVEPPPAAKK